MLCLHNLDTRLISILKMMCASRAHQSDEIIYLSLFKGFWFYYCPRSVLAYKELQNQILGHKYTSVKSEYSERSTDLEQWNLKSASSFSCNTTFLIDFKNSPARLIK